MDILDKPEHLEKHHWNRHAGRIELVAFLVYLTGSLLVAVKFPDAIWLRLAGLAGLIVTYGVIYTKRVQLKKHALNRWQFIMFTSSFILLALYVMTIALSLMTYLPFWGRESFSNINLVITASNFTICPAIVITFFYSFFIWHRIGKKEPTAYSFARIIWPRQMLLVAVWMIYYALIGIKL